MFVLLCGGGHSTTKAYTLVMEDVAGAVMLH